MRKYRNYKISEIFIKGMLSISTILFILMPFLYVFKESFIINGELDFRYYYQILNNSQLLTNTLKLGLITSILSVITSVTLALFIFLTKNWIKKIITLILSISLISPPFVTSLSYISLFGRRGFITYRLLGLSLSPYNMWGVVSMQTLAFLSLNTLIISGFLNSIDKDSINSARSLGANTNRIIVDIILPQIKNPVLTVFLLSFFKAVSDFATPSIIGGKFNVLALQSYFEVIANGNLAKASSMNVLLLIPVVLLFILLGNRINTQHMSSNSKSSMKTNIKRDGIIYNIIKIISILLVILVSMLYISIIVSAFTTMSKGSLVLSLKNFEDTGKYINDSMLRSIGYSLIAAFAGTLIGLLIGYYVIIKNSKLMKYIDAISNLPYIIPGTFFGLGYLLFFKSTPIVLTGTSAIVVLNVLFKQLPFSTRLGNSAMVSIDRNIINSIRDLGANSFYEIKDGIIPNIKSSIGISLINSFTATMTTVGSIIFLVYPGKKLMTLVMFDVINSGKYDQGSVIALIIMVICLIFNLLVSKFIVKEGTFNKFS